MKKEKICKLLVGGKMSEKNQQTQTGRLMVDNSDLVVWICWNKRGPLINFL